eukprot:365682-Chlamydomonas_euryale.AAC.12
MAIRAKLPTCLSAPSLALLPADGTCKSKISDIRNYLTKSGSAKPAATSEEFAAALEGTGLPAC